MLEPLCRYPTNAILQAAAERLFEGTNSTRVFVRWAGPGFGGGMKSDLVKVPAFRRMLARELNESAVCGSVTWRQGYAQFGITNPISMSGSVRLDLPEDEMPAEGDKTELRRRDWIALTLSNEKIIPPFDPFASLARRDEAIVRARALLE